MMGVEAAKFNFNRVDVVQNRRITINIDRRRAAKGITGLGSKYLPGCHALRKETPY
jgi:hypothetical protein